MTNQSNDFLKARGFKPRIKFSDRQEHKFEFLSGAMDSVDFGSGGGDETVMRYLVKEDGEEKEITTTSLSLVQALADAEAGDLYSVKLVSKNVNGKMISTFDVKQISGNPGTAENSGDPGPQEPQGAEDEINIEDIPF